MMNSNDERVIELSELRIGNLLNYKGEIVSVTMLSCDIDDEYEEQICFVKLGTSSNEKGGWNRSLVNDLKRIPLDSEWLERCGFVKKQNRWVGDKWYAPVKEFDEDYHFVEIDGDKIIYYACAFANGHDGAYPIEIKSVHQLQNIFYWLTMGEELTIKEKA